MLQASPGNVAGAKCSRQVGKLRLCIDSVNRCFVYPVPFSVPSCWICFPFGDQTCFEGKDTCAK